MLRNFDEKEEEVEKEADRDVRHLHYLLSQSGLLAAVCDVPLGQNSIIFFFSNILFNTMYYVQSLP